MNIYSDVAPYLHSAVFVMRGKTRSEIEKNITSEHYINASYIDAANGRQRGIIATQGPQPNTVVNFWDMVLENNCTRILTVAHKIGGGDWSSDACQYFPDKAAESCQFGDIKITNEAIKITDHVKTRKLRVEKDGKTFNCIHTHFTSWPDFDVPLKESRS